MTCFDLPFVPLTGVATGLPGKKNIDRNDLKPNVVKSKHVAPNTLTGADVLEGSLAEVPAAASAGAPAAFARVVDAPGNEVGVDEARSRGIADAMLGNDNGAQNGMTCFDLPFVPKGAQVSIDYAQAPGETAELTAQVALGDPFSNCNAPFRDAIVRVHSDTGAGAEEGFFVAFYK
jgi:hypothetical protein